MALHDIYIVLGGSEWAVEVLEPARRVLWSGV
jgi:hypothetical protein